MTLIPTLALSFFMSNIGGVTLPKALGIWTRSDNVRTILPEKIFDYMDGAGELYLGYRFKHLEVAEYSAPAEDQILVELYWMESSDDAFGLLSGDWGGEPVDLGGPARARGGPEWFSDSRALYGAGLLRIWSDNLYARIMAYRETASSREAVIRLGRLIVEGRRNLPPPAMVGALPEKTADHRLRTDRFCYFRSHLVLNSVYFLGTKNILELDRSAEAVTATYSASAGSARPAQLLLIRYADERSARKALAHFEEAYLPEHGSPAPKTERGEGRYRKIEDGWLGCQLDGRLVALVFECPDRDTAVRFIGESIKRLHGLEARHE